MNPQTPSRLPRRVLYAFVGITLLAAAALFAYSLLTGWTPPRNYAGVVLPLHFGLFLACLTLSYVISGNTLMFHLRTGTVQRATDPGWFWSIVAVQSVITVALLVAGCVQWSKLYG